MPNTLSAAAAALLATSLLSAGCDSRSAPPGAAPSRAPAANAAAPTGSAAAPNQVQWTVQEGGGGSVNSSGQYTAPSTAGDYHVVAASAVNPLVAGSALVHVTAGSSSEIIPADRRTTWNPGLMSQGGLPIRNTLCATLSPSGGDDTAAINAAIQACPATQVVKLNAGTYRISGQGILLNRSNVVLRGAVDANGRPTARLVKVTGTNAAVVVLGNRWTSDKFGTATNLASNGVKGATSVTLASNPGFTVGELVMIDQLPDSRIWLSARMSPGGGDYPQAQGWFNRQGRFTNQILEVASVSGNTVTFSTPLHYDFYTAYTAQLVKYTNAPTSWHGLEDVYVANGEGGDSEGNIHLWHAKYSWVKNVESYWSGGSSINFDGTFRCEVRDSYIHETPTPRPGGGGYGLSMNYGASDNLFENNIVMRFNKVMVMRATGGGNVIGYNYMDDGYIDNVPGWQEVGINAAHMAGAHMELFEGNMAFGAGSDDAWGGATHNTFFRNALRGLNRDFNDTTDVAVVKIMQGHRYYNFVGNVLGWSGMTGWTFEDLAAPYGERNIWELGYSAGNRSSVTDALVGSTILRHGNWDYVRNQQDQYGTTTAAMPSSLYLSGRPAFFGTNAWPWVTPEGTTKAGTLPARARYDNLLQ
ncbi:MAG: glycosyl hydrolase family 28-related protein [Anaeromyxobacter sp.]